MLVINPLSNFLKNNSPFKKIGLIGLDFAQEKIAVKKNGPVLIGEFHPWGDNKVWEMYIKKFSSNNWSWTLWTYKCSGKAGDWGIYRTSVSPDILKDSFNELSNKFTRYSTEFATTDKKQIDVFKNSGKLSTIKQTTRSVARDPRSEKRKFHGAKGQ